MALLTKTKADHTDLLRSHVWGCPVFVLDPKLQDDKKIPKRNQGSCIGQFVEFSHEHSSLVANVHHLMTGFVSPQYHVVFDDLFQTVFSTGDCNAVVDEICNNLFEFNRYVYVEDEFDIDGNLVYHPPPLDEVWLDEHDGRDQIDWLHHPRAITKEREQSKCLCLPAHMVVSDSDDDDFYDVSSAPSHQEGECHTPDGDLGGDTGGDDGNDFDLGGNCGVDEQDTAEHISPRYPRRNQKKKDPLTIDFTNR